VERQRPRNEAPPAPRPAAGRPQPVNIPTGWQPKREAWMPLPPEPHLPAPWDDADAEAFKRLNLGTASPEQQQRAMHWLVFASGFTGPSYVPGDPYAAGHGEGKRWLMIQIDRMIRSRFRGQADSEQG